MSDCFIPIELAEVNWQNGLPFSKQFNDLYFSTNDPIPYSQYIYIDGNHLQERFIKLQDEIFVVGETGFGLGLNFLLTWKSFITYAPPKACLRMLSCEKFPVEKKDMARFYDLFPDLQDEANKLINQYPVLTPGFHTLIFDNGRIQLTLLLGDVLDSFKELLISGDPHLEKQFSKKYVDAWFLDGFSPSKNREMWSEDLFYIISLLSKSGTSFSTYSTARIVKENAEQAGFSIEKPKQFGHKYEILQGDFIDSNMISKFKYRKTPWQVTPLKKVEEKKAIILGAGLGGACLANALAKRHWSVQVIEAKNEPGSGASGNRQAVLYPNLSAYRSPLTQFMLSSFLFAHPYYQRLLEKYPLGHLNGILQLASNEKEKKTQKSLAQWLQRYPELGELIQPDVTDYLIGISLQEEGLYIPRSGWIDSHALCHQLLDEANISLSTNQLIEEIHFADGKWHAGDASAEVLILANGYSATQFEQTKSLSLRPLRGQMTYLPETPSSNQLKIPICGEAHVTPAFNKNHAVGATYHLEDDQNDCFVEDDLLNVKRLLDLQCQVSWSSQVAGHWSGVRGATLDYLPLVGLVPNEETFVKQFSGLRSNSKRWIPQYGSFLDGLYLFAGFGSRGLTTIPLSAEYLVGFINNEFSILPQSLVKAISPARFLIKKLIKNT